MPNVTEAMKNLYKAFEGAIDKSQINIVRCKHCGRTAPIPAQKTHEDAFGDIDHDDCGLCQSASVVGQLFRQR